MGDSLESSRFPTESFTDSQFFLEHGHVNPHCLDHPREKPPGCLGGMFLVLKCAVDEAGCRVDGDE